MSCDPTDEYISDNASLKSNISKLLLKQFKTNNLIKTELSSKPQTDLFKIIFDEEDSKSFIDSLIFIISKINTNTATSDKEKEILEKQNLTKNAKPGMILFYNIF